MPHISNCEGALSKWTNMIQGWQFRWFVLDVQNGLLSYYTSKENMSKGERRGCIRLRDAFIGYDNEDDITFTINTTGAKTFHLQAKNLEEREKWVSKIDKTIRLQSKLKGAYLSRNSIDSNKIFRIKTDSLLNDEFDDFKQFSRAEVNKKYHSCLTETDAYLQLLIEQLKQLKEKRNSLFEVNNDTQNKISKTDKHSTENKITEENFNSILNETENLIDTIQHAIVCLQIVKANDDPKNDFEVGKDLSQAILNFNKNKTNQSKSSYKLPESIDENLNSSITSNINHKITFDSSDKNKKENSQNQRNDLNLNENKTKSIKKRNIMVPAASYSSSDQEDNPNTILKSSKTSNGEELQQNYPIDYDEEDDENDSDYSGFFSSKMRRDDNDSDSFYDAIDQTSIASHTLTEASKNQTSILETFSSDNEQISSNEQISKKITSFDDKKVISLSSSESSIFTSKANKSLIDQKILDEYDLFDEDAPPEDIDLNNQQSVITHLLTQVRIGMDLTKITLPTFILETRSLLEMYADFFAHTDLFLQIVDFKSPHDRMIQVVKWYLSTFHAGRKSPVAKKPYNPILGEIFQCWYDIPSFSSNDNTLVSDGPVPWANKDQLTFIAEQVSHHPPISAFYAEHYNKRIQLDGYTWTKSKFLGLSIGVHMVGKAVLSLLDYDEEYILTFPSAFGRSILTVPWFEMGGQVSITCAKSGFYSNIDFLTKPFYGGKKHQIQGTIYGPDKKALHTLDGDWNGTMFIKNGKKQDILISTQSTPTIKKKVRSLNDQLDNESRKLWREVTYYLRSKQIESATSAKQFIEQKQRDETKYRKEHNIKWSTKYFHEQGENWIYVKPLIKRLQKS